jgi:hypothetical protein
MDQDNKKNIPHKRGYKQSPASPALQAQRDTGPLQGGNPRCAPSAKGVKGDPGHIATAKPANDLSGRPSCRPRHPTRKIRPADPLTLRRVSRLLTAVRPLLGSEITTAWLARTMVRVDGGPMLAPYGARC